MRYHASARDYNQIWLDESAAGQPSLPGPLPRLDFPFPPDEVHGTAGNDFIHIAGDGLIAPPGYNDIPGATDGDDVIDAGSGDDIIYSGDGADQIHAGSGNDVVNFNGAATVHAGTGNDVINVGWLPASGLQTTIDGESGVDKVSLGLFISNTIGFNFVGVNVHLADAATGWVSLPAQDSGVVMLTHVEQFDITFGSGNDVVYGWKYADHLEGDSYNFPGGDDELHGGGGDDSLNGMSGSDALYGDSGNDTLDGGESSPGYLGVDGSSDTLYGGAGDDLLIGGQSDFLSGGTGYNRATLDLRYATVSYNVSLDRLTSGHFYDLGDSEGGLPSTRVQGIQHVDEIDLGSGHDRVTGDVSSFGQLFMGGGNDAVTLTGTMSGVYLDGGEGFDTLTLAGDYSALFWLDYNAVVNFERLVLTDGYDYNLKFGSSGPDFTRIDASALTGDHTLTLDATLGANDHAVILGGAGADTFNFGSALLASQHIDGGDGQDTLVLGGNFALAFAPATIANVETIALQADPYLGSYIYNLRTSNGNVAAGQTLTIDGSELGQYGNADVLKFNGSKEIDGHLVVLGGRGNDALTGGAQADTIMGGDGADMLNGFGGGDTFVYTAVSQSEKSALDKISGFDAASDKLDLWYSVTGIDATLSGDYANLASIADAGHLAAHHALLFDGSDGHTYLVIDSNGTAGYQVNQDMVIRLDSAAHLDSLSTGNFI
jgi:Ca2+-binding RTX toxin-like protein